MKDSYCLSRELKAYARAKGVRVMRHTALSADAMECARALVDECAALLMEIPPGRAGDVATCHVHRLVIWVEREGRHAIN